MHASLMDAKDALIEAVPFDAERLLDVGVGTGLELIDIVVVITSEVIAALITNTVRNKKT